SGASVKNLVAGLALVLAQGAFLSAAPIEVRAPVSEVMVFPTGAKVLRQGEADLPSGPVTVAFPGLPAEVDQDSIRLSVEGPKGTRFYGLHSGQVFSPRETSKRRG